MSAIAVRTAVELVHYPGETARARQALAALASAAVPAGLAVVDGERYRGGADWLLLWGPGAPNRFEAMARQIAAGGHVIALDLSYWERETKFRLSIDAAHPQAWVMRRALPRARFEAVAVTVLNLWNPKGPIVVAGLGDKARVQYGPDHVDAWERAAIAAAAASGRPVVYRPKRASGSVPPGTRPAPAGSIEHALDGASAVITYHSNVAVDAIRLGVPVICANGAAAAVCPSTWPADHAPHPLAEDVRDRFLSNLAWFQWAPDESDQAWAFLKDLLA